MSNDIKYWEDLRSPPVRRYGPLTFPTALLDQLLDLMGEKHPIHASDGFAQSNDRKKRIIPGGFIHSITSGWIVQHGSPVAILGLRSMTWDFVRPLYPDTSFYFTTETSSAEEIDDKTGVVNTVRRVCNENGQTYAIGRMSVVMKRRPTNIAS
ncbi:MAG: MaoC family dehydratase [Xanthobacteraceae bacterium]